MATATSTTSDGGAWLDVLVATAGALVLLWVLLVLTLWVAGRRLGEPTGLREAVRLLPDVLVLLKRLAGDRGLPRSVRWRLVALLAYLAFPLDLVPDVIPVIGYADDVVVVAWVLRSVVRAGGPEALERHWPGSPQGLAVVRRLAGLGGG